MAKVRGGLWGGSNKSIVARATFRTEAEAGRGLVKCRVVADAGGSTTKVRFGTGEIGGGMEDG
jgi:hypothetical protein